MPDWYVRNYINDYDSYIFNSAIGNPIGISYEPLIVATTETSLGTAYRYICKALVQNPVSNRTFLTVVDIFKPYNFSNREEQPYVTEITQLDKLNLNTPIS